MLIAYAAPPPQLPVPETCVLETPCVYATPDASEAGQRDELRVYYGRGWKPGTPISLGYGSPCYPPADACTLELRIAQDAFTADADGRFTFVARNGAGPQPGPAASIATRGVDGFDGLAADGRRVGRTPRRVPGPSTPAERRQGAAIVHVTRMLLRDIGRAHKRSAAAFERHEREIARCRPIIEIERPRARAAAIERAVDASEESASYGVDHRAFVLFAKRLRALRVTDPQLAAGVSAWAHAIAAPRPTVRPALCAALRRWRAAGYPLAHPPVPGRARLLSEDVRGSEAISAATERLVDLGLPRTPWVEQFAGRVLGLENYIDF